MQTRSYTNDPNQTPTVTYQYDGVNVTGGMANAKGKLTAVSTSGTFVSSYSYDRFDAVGQVLQSTQTVEAHPPSVMQYAYDLAGKMKSQVYPSGRVVATEYDVAGRVAGVKNAISGSYYAGGAATDPVNRLQYSAHGAVSALRLGNGLWEHTTFNSRLQPEQIGLGTVSTNSSVLQLDYSYGTTNNNGNVQSQTLTLPGGFSLTQSYQYDAVNRLKLAQENGGASWKQVYAYDQYGNRTFETGTTVPAPLTDPAVNPAISAATNRINDQGYGYDAAGNLTTLSGQQLTYDGESRQVSANVGGEYGLSLYRYDGEGRRVKKVTSNGTTTIYVYNVLGQLVAEYSTASPAPAGGTSYLTADHLGTPRVITNADGGVQARHDYLPFGEEISINVGGRSTGQGYIYGSGLPDPLRHKFTGTYERDVETNLDYAQARYYASAHGRFTSADPLLASARAADPQTWNRYAYCGNNPLNRVDPSGLDWWYKKGGSSEEQEWFDRDPGEGYERWSNAGGYVYQSDTSGTWWALNPNANQALAFDNADDAYDAFYNFGGSTGGDVVLTMAQREFTAGFSTGLSPVGLLFTSLYEAQGLDTTSRDFRIGTAAGIVAGFGLGGAGLLSAGSEVPNAGGVIRSFTTTEDQVFYRVFSESPTGGWLTAVPPRSSAWAREALALHPGNQASFIQEVLVPSGTTLQRSRALPAFGRRGGAEQFRLLQELPRANFGPGRPLR